MVAVFTLQILYVICIICILKFRIVFNSCILANNTVLFSFVTISYSEDLFWAHSSICGRDCLGKYFTAFGRWLFLQKSFIMNVHQGSKYPCAFYIFLTNFLRNSLLWWHTVFKISSAKIYITNFFSFVKLPPSNIIATSVILHKFYVLWISPFTDMINIKLKD